jgi:hypothetical protein
MPNLQFRSSRYIRGIRRRRIVASTPRPHRCDRSRGRTLDRPGEIGRAVALFAGDPAQSSFPFRTRARINEKSFFIIRQCRTDFVSPMTFCSCIGGRKRPLHHHTGERQSRFLFDHLTRNRQRGGRQRCCRLSGVSIIRDEARDWLSCDVQLTQLR